MRISDMGVVAATDVLEVMERRLRRMGDELLGV